ncbi:MAG: Asp23/Gls24 family envelope stress response protein [Synergistales bacterium]|nr:Asp23/Gls24 family envelope stress response protein [Synergistales bacterium]
MERNEQEQVHTEEANVEEQVPEEGRKPDKEGLQVPSETPEGESPGEVRITEEVILQLASHALKTIQGVKPAGAGPLASLGLGRKTSGGIRIALDEDTPPRIMVDTYVSVKYGMRIPDVAWDVQESVKKHLEQYTGYMVKSVNVYIQAIHLSDRDHAESREEKAREGEQAKEPKTEEAAGHEEAEVEQPAEEQGEPSAAESVSRDEEKKNDTTASA